MESISLSRVSIITTVSITYTLKNPAQDIKGENGWKVFPQDVEGAYFGIQGQLQPDQSVSRRYTFTVAAPSGLLVFADPSNITDSSWDEDDLTWIFNP